MIWSAGKSPWKGGRKQNPDHRRGKGRGEPWAEGGHFFHWDSKGWRTGQRPQQVTLRTSGSESEEFLSQLSTWVSSVIWVWQATARKERKLQQKLRRIARPFESSVETSIQDKTVPWKARLWGFSPTEFSPISVGSRGTRTKGSLLLKAARVMKGHWEGCWEDRWGDRTKKSQWTELVELASEITHTTSHS